MQGTNIQPAIPAQNPGAASIKSVMPAFTAPDATDVLFVDILRQSMAVDARVNNLGKATQEKQQYMFNNVQRWMTETGQSELKIHQVRIRHMEHLRQWLLENVKRWPSDKSISIDHATRHLRLCRKACYYAVDYEYLPHNPIAGIKTKKGPPKQVVSCTMEEVQLLETFQAPKWKWQQLIIRDIFLFQCHTGLSYMDLWLFDIMQDQGVWWVTSKHGRGKNNRMYWAELSPKAKQIYDRYPDGFPVISLQTYNRSIKKIAKALGIQRHLTTHIARKTFATLKRHEGYSMPAIAAMLGNTEVVARTHYVAPGKELIMAERRRLDIVQPKPEPTPVVVPMCKPMPFAIVPSSQADTVPESAIAEFDYAAYLEVLMT